MSYSRLPLAQWRRVTPQNWRLPFSSWRYEALTKDAATKECNPRRGILLYSESQVAPRREHSQAKERLIQRQGLAVTQSYMIIRSTMERTASNPPCVSMYVKHNTAHLLQLCLLTKRWTIQYSSPAFPPRVFAFKIYIPDDEIVPAAYKIAGFEQVVERSVGSASVRDLNPRILNTRLVESQWFQPTFFSACWM